MGLKSLKIMTIFTTLLLTVCLQGSEFFETDTIEFRSSGKRLSGLLDVPNNVEAVGFIIYVHGYGKTNVVEGNWYYSFRSRFAKLGFSVLIWDKPGCGASEGEFDIDQPVSSSATEVVDAIETLRLREIPGSEKVGLWGISRAGWIAPLAINKDPTIAFWISVSGTDEKENFKYLLQQNFHIEGRSAEESELLVSEWQNSFDALRSGATYETYLDADQNLRADPFYQYITNNSQPYDKPTFMQEQERYLSGEIQVDEETGLMIYVPEFEKVLNAVNCPVLAIFGEKDTSVDWRKTLKLYQQTIGRNPGAKLTIKTFANCNHSMRKCETGGFREMIESINYSPYCDGYYDTMISWLKTEVGIIQ